MAIEISTGRRENRLETKGSRRINEMSLPPGIALYRSSNLDGGEYLTRGNIKVKIPNREWEDWKMKVRISQRGAEDASALAVGDEMWVHRSALNRLRSERKVPRSRRRERSPGPVQRVSPRARMEQGTLDGILNHGSHYYDDGL